MAEEIDSGMIMGLEEEIFTDLSMELSVTDKNFNETILLSKVRNAMREVKRARKYPGYYTDEAIEKDMNYYFSNIRNIALYDYSKIGGNFEKSHSENSVSRSFSDRDKLFAGIIPLSRKA